MTMRWGRTGVFGAVFAAAMGMTGVARAGGAGLSGDVTVVSRYMAHGWNISDNEPHVFLSGTVDAVLPGLQFALWSAVIMDRDMHAGDEFDYLVKYNRTCCPSSRWAANVHGYVDYWFYPHLSVREDKDGQAIPRTKKKGMKYHAGITLPKLLPIGPGCLVPSYNVYYWMPVERDLFESGAAHELFLSYGFPLAEIAESLGKGNSLALSGSLTYHDGAFGVDAGWSHATAHLAVPLRLWTLTVTPSVNHQWSFEDTVNPTDEFWAALSVGGGW